MPTREAARAALDYLMDPLETLDFVDDVSRA
jgi:hypothetical protein